MAFHRSSLAFGLIPNRMKSSATKCYAGTAGDANLVDQCRISRFITNSFAANPVMTLKTI